MKEVKISFLGFGEAASSIALGLSQEGAKGLRGYDILLEDTEKRQRVLDLMKQSGTEPARNPGEAVQGADVIFSAVPADFAVATAEQAAPFLKNGCVLVDVTTASPEEKKKIADMTEHYGAGFVDGAMLGPLLQYHHQVPMLLSGSGCEMLLERMREYHMNLTVVNQLPGAATSIKFIRSITAKGLACLLFESFQAAQHFHVEEMIAESLCESYGGAFEKVMDNYLSGTIIHAKRREHEMRNVVDFLESAGLPDKMAEATRGKLEEIAGMKLEQGFAEGVPRNWRGVLEGWKL